MTTIKEIKQQIIELTGKTIDQIKQDYGCLYDMRQKTTWISILEIVQKEDRDLKSEEESTTLSTSCSTLHIPQFPVELVQALDEAIATEVEIEADIQVDSDPPEVDAILVDSEDVLDDQEDELSDADVKDLLDHLDTLPDSEPNDDDLDLDDLDELLDGYKGDNEPLQTGFITRICTRITEEYNHNKFVISDLWHRAKRLYESRREVTKKIRHTCLDRFEFLLV